MTEPGAGSNLQGMKTFAERDGDDFVLNGSKVFITGGINADMVLGMTLYKAHNYAKNFKSVHVLTKTR